MKDFIGSVKVFSGIHDLMDLLKKKNLIQGIVSSKTKEGDAKIMSKLMQNIFLKSRRI
jgi:hypothetical protein